MNGPKNRPKQHPFFWLLFERFVFLCLQIKSASDSEAQKAKAARGVKKSEETGLCA